MTYTQWHDSPLGKMLLAADGTGLTGVWFDGEKYFAYHLETQHEEKDTQLLQQTKRWLDIYFNGKEPDFTVPCHRVIGANGSLTGYAAGLNKKIKLLTLEKADVKSLFMPKPAGGD